MAKLDRQAQLGIFRYLKSRIATPDNPRRFGKALTGGLAGLWRYRVRDYRILCRLEKKVLIVVVVAVGHRSIVYDA